MSQLDGRPVEELQMDQDTRMYGNRGKSYLDSVERKLEIPQTEQPWSRKSIAGFSVVIGSYLALFLGAAGVFIALVAVITGTIFSFLGYSEVKKKPYLQGKALAVWGIILGCISIVIVLGIMLILFLLVGAFVSLFA